MLRIVVEWSDVACCDDSRQQRVLETHTPAIWGLCRLSPLLTEHLTSIRPLLAARGHQIQEVVRGRDQGGHWKASIASRGPPHETLAARGCEGNKKHP